MAKELNSKRLQIVITLTQELPIDPIEVHAEAKYEVKSDDLTSSRGISDIEITPTQKTAIKSFAVKVIQQIKAKENIPEA